MPSVLRRLLQRVTPPMLRSDSPDRPMFVRRRHWLTHETRFLFLTRKGPVEIIVKPGMIIGAAFVGIVGTSVIAATTLFLGFKSVEVVRNESITTAEANMPTIFPDQEPGGAWLDPLGRDRPLVDGGQTDGGQTDGGRADIDLPNSTAAEILSAEMDSPVRPAQAEDGDKPEKIIELAALTAPVIRWPPSLAASDAAPIVILPQRRPAIMAIPKAENLDEPDMMVPVPQLDDDHMAMADNDAGLDGLLAGNISPDMPNGADEAPAVNETPLALAAGLTTAPALPVFPSLDLEGGLESDSTGEEPPVLTRAGRELKVLRSMAREVSNIRSSLGGLGLNETLMPQLEDIDGLIKAQDFAGLAMAVEDHRSMLRKVPLKPPMLYFYVTSEYGYRIHPVLKTKRFHHGIDLAGTWQETVHATAPGTVIFAGNKGSFGKTVQVRHAYGVITTYAHLSKITVRKGADVGVGTVVGRMGRTGRVDGAHLHYEIRIGEKSLNPRFFFAIGHRIGVGGELLRTAD
ncbi:MAG: peptidoglycan DD-metalloendopeptidase family protein [Candidatus Puniceispirillaceae bacterium]